MFRFERHRGSSRPHSPEDFTAKGAIILAMKQIGFLIVIGCIIWLAHTLAHSRSHAATTPHDLSKGNKTEITATAVHSPNHISPTNRAEATATSARSHSCVTAQSAHDTEPHNPQPIPAPEQQMSE